MKLIQPLLFSFFLVICPLLSIGSHVEVSFLIERKKEIVKEFDVKNAHVFSVTNQYGDVKVNLWDKKTIRVEIKILAHAPTDELAQSYLDAVSITENNSGNTISLATKIKGQAFGKSIKNKQSNGERNVAQINYVIFMPQDNRLAVHNTFGNVDIAYFKAPLTVNCQYGSFTAKDLQSADNHIDISFGNGNILKMNSGKLNAQYSDLKLSQGQNINIINKFGNLNIGDIADIGADIQYSKATIDLVRGNGKINLSFSEKFSVKSLASTSKKMDIHAAYSAVTLPAESTNFDVTVSYGKFNYPKDVNMTLMPDKSSDLTKRYKGTVGAGSGAILTITSQFGNVSLQN
jgi:hypothetical protein